MKTKRAMRRIILWLFLMLSLIPVVFASECPHEWAERRIDPTCAEKGLVWRECLLCGDTTGYEVLNSLPHSFGEWYVLEAPGCNREGQMARTCSACSHQEIEVIAKAGHDYMVEIIEPTCTARGYTRYRCSRCTDQYTADYLPPLGHHYEGVIIREPTLENSGEIRYTCTNPNCGKTYQDYLPKYTNPFVDIDKDSFYFTPVLWAANNGITSGVDETHFAPGGTCTRAQVVTFLWSRAGKPEPKSMENPFRDVPRGSFCEKAVLWAYETGITSGTDSTHFSPGAPCYRAQVVTFLHQFRGHPDPTTVAAFPDVRPSDFYYKAVLWAAERGITAGMDGGYFRPGYICNRAQIVTFLYRDFKNP